LPDATNESNPTRNPKKTLPYVFAPSSKNKLDVVTLRTLLAQSKSQTIAVRHLLINDNEAMPVNIDRAAPISTTAAAAAAAATATTNLKAFSSSKRSFIQSIIVEFFAEIHQMKQNDGTAAIALSQAVGLLLREPACLDTGDKEGKKQPRTRGSALTASAEYLSTTLAARNEARNELHAKADLLPLFLASPAYLALYALYLARVTYLLPRAQHGAAHMRDNGLIDRFLANGYSLSDEVTVHFSLPTPASPPAAVLKPDVK
jgi:hypothetical protein